MARPDRWMSWQFDGVRQGTKLIKEFKPSELVAFSRFPLWLRAMFRLMEKNTTLRRNERIVVYRY